MIPKNRSITLLVALPGDKSILIETQDVRPNGSLGKTSVNLEIPRYAITEADRDRMRPVLRGFLSALRADLILHHAEDIALTALDRALVACGFQPIDNEVIDTADIFHEILKRQGVEASTELPSLARIHAVEKTLQAASNACVTSRMKIFTGLWMDVLSRVENDMSALPLDPDLAWINNLTPQEIDLLGGIRSIARQTVPDGWRRSDAVLVRLSLAKGHDPEALSELLDRPVEEIAALAA